MRAGVAKWLSQRAESALKRVKLPEAGIGTLSVKNGTLLATMAGEPIPRRFDNLSVKVHLSPDYRNMTVDLTGEHPASVQYAKKHHFRQVFSKGCRSEMWLVCGGWHDVLVFPGPSFRSPNMVQLPG